MTYIWPLADALAHVTQEYGGNRNAQQPGGHTGMDFGFATGTPIYAEADGVIVFADWADKLGWPNVYYIATSAIRPGGAGICVGLDVGPFQFWHAHCVRTDRNNGDHVKQGDIIGYVGDTGYAFGAHLHLDVLPDGWNVNSADGRYGRVNPRNVIDGIAAVKPQGSVLKSNQRRVGASPVNQRKSPNVGAEIVRVIPPGTVEVWDGFVRGETVNWNGEKNDLWYKDGAGYASVLFFDPLTTAGLLDLTPAPPPPLPEPTPAPTPAPVPVPADPVLFGVDVSNHQGGIDLVGLPGDIVVMKASEGVGYTDPGLGVRAGQVLPGRIRGFYHFARPNATPENTAAAEAAYFLEVVRPYLRAGDLLVLDWESDAITDTAWAQKFLRIVAGATGATPLIYMNVSAVNGADWSAVEAEFPLWLANYVPSAIGGGYAVPRKPDVTWSKGFRMLQYTSQGRLPGWAGDLDLNVWYGTRADATALGVTVIPSTPGVPPVPVPAVKTVPGIDDTIRSLVEYYGN